MNMPAFSEDRSGVLRQRGHATATAIATYRRTVAQKMIKISSRDSFQAEQTARVSMPCAFRYKRPRHLEFRVAPTAPESALAHNTNRGRYV
jgi:hypothetical protein